jgi:hypothetical protein
MYKFSTFYYFLDNSYITQSSSDKTKAFANADDLENTVFLFKYKKMFMKKKNDMVCYFSEAGDVYCEDAGCLVKFKINAIQQKWQFGFHVLGTWQKNKPNEQ